MGTYPGAKEKREKGVAEIKTELIIWVVCFTELRAWAVAWGSAGRRG